MKKLKFHHLAGGTINQKPPIFSANGDYLFFLANDKIKIFSPITGQFIRQLDADESPLIDMGIEFRTPDVITACSEMGQLFRWDWKSGELKSKIKIDLMTYPGRCGILTNYQLLNWFGKSELCYGFICQKITNQNIKWHVIDRTTGLTINNIHSPLKLGMTKPLLVVDTENFPNLVLVQGFYVYFVNYENWTYQRLMNAHRVPVTVVRTHPREECVATGDEIGRIFLWRNFYNQKGVCTSLYHWHHTMVTSIAFTPSGANFYSGGQEAVMVNWNVENPDQRHYLPRMVSRISHIVVSPNNTQIAVAMVDNGVQIIGTEKKVYDSLQELTYIADDKTGKDKFPVGLRFNPRTNTMVLNGRTGCLQFYNTYTKTLLYNLNVVNENLLSMERDKILYDTRVVRAAFNIDWMATGEVFNDEETLPEVRLKFWLYQVESKSYVLNTCIELPHQGGFRAIEFSSRDRTESLLCATAGEDNYIRTWFLGESNNIYRKGKRWYCAARTNYRGNDRLESISFSCDGSILAAGFGSILCLYKADLLKLKAALSSVEYDGCVCKVEIRLPDGNSKNAEQSQEKDTISKVNKSFVTDRINIDVEERGTSSKDDFSSSEVKEMLKNNFYKELFNDDDDRDGVVKAGGGSELTETEDDFEVMKVLNFSKDEENEKEAEKEFNETSLHHVKDNEEVLDSLQTHEAKEIITKVLEMEELSILEKLMIFQRLGILGMLEVNERYKETLNNYIKSYNPDRDFEMAEKELYRLNWRQRFQEAFRFYEYKRLRDKYHEKVEKYLVPLTELCKSVTDDEVEVTECNSNETNLDAATTSSNSECKQSSKSITKRRKLSTAPAECVVEIISDSEDDQIPVLSKTRGQSRQKQQQKQREKEEKKREQAQQQEESSSSEDIEERIPNGFMKNDNHEETHSRLSSLSTAYRSAYVLSKLSTAETPPPKFPPQIRFVEFGHGCFSHLVICCTERRILLWNILTLKLEATMNLTVKHLCFDPESNLLAVLLQNNQLQIISLETYTALEIQYDMPDLYGMLWVPRHRPKDTIVLVDWQSQSTLYFLTKSQEIKYFESQYSEEGNEPVADEINRMASLQLADASETPLHSTFGTIPCRTHQEVSSRSDLELSMRDMVIADGPLVLKRTDKDAVKMLLEMSIHTMPPASRLRDSFIESMIQKVDCSKRDEDSATSHVYGSKMPTTLTVLQRKEKDLPSSFPSEKPLTNGYATITNDCNGDDGDLSSEDGDIDKDMEKDHRKLRRAIMNKTKELHSQQSNFEVAEGLKHSLQILTSREYYFDF